MPIYEYECPRCGRFEAIQGSSEKPLKAKPECEEKSCPRSAKRVISPAAFHLKGTGWYKTDYASKNGTAGSSAKPKPDSSTKKEASEAPAAGCGTGSCGCKSDD